jgi:SAM-dependent methyltransferase
MRTPWPRLDNAVALLEWRHLRASPARCPLCGPSVIVQLGPSPVGTRCVRCAASGVTMALVAVLRQEVGALDRLHVYELSSRGPLVNWLRRHAGRLTCSEWFDGGTPGEMVDGVQCQDVQQLTFATGSFDVCTSTEVFEHVPDDARGFAELRRVLRPGGRLVFSVPVWPVASTVERARLSGNGGVEHLLPAEYHGDRIRGRGRVLAYRNYGSDVLERVAAQGFRDVRFAVSALGPWAPPIVVATA